MKLLLNILCWILTIFCFYFPFTYYSSNMNKKDYRISHINVDSQEQIQNILKEIQDKKISFEQAAKDYSLCPSKDRDGDLGYNSKDMLSDEFLQTVKEMKKNEISNPVKSEEGWHIIKLTDVKYFSDKDGIAKRY